MEQDARSSGKIGLTEAGPGDWAVSILESSILAIERCDSEGLFTIRRLVWSAPYRICRLVALRESKAFILAGRSFESSQGMSSIRWGGGSRHIGCVLCWRQRFGTQRVVILIGRHAGGLAIQI